MIPIKGSSTKKRVKHFYSDLLTQKKVTELLFLRLSQNFEENSELSDQEIDSLVTVKFSIENV